MSMITPCPKGASRAEINASLADDFHQHAFGPTAFGDRDDNFPPHHLAFVMGVGVVVARAIVVVTFRQRIKGSQLIQLFLVVIEPPGVTRHPFVL